MKLQRTTILFLFLSLLLFVLFVYDLMTGATDLSYKEIWGALIGGNVPESTIKIVRNIRLIKVIVAVIAGIALSVSGLQMQTLFRNPLAGPYILGISSGAGLGVALFIIGAPFIGIAGNLLFTSMGIAGAAWIGAATILLIITFVCLRIKDIMVILILGMMFSSGVSAIVQILQYISNVEALKTFVIWTMGSLGSVTATQLYILIPAVIAGLAIGIIVIKPLNLLLMGENYALTMGLNLRRSRFLIFLSTTLLAGTVTAFCGPIGFIGLAAPHVSRAIFANADHRILVPASALVGANAMLFCDIISKSFTLPINTITSLLGIPVVIWIVLSNKNIAQ